MATYIYANVSSSAVRFGNSLENIRRVLRGDLSRVVAVKVKPSITAAMIFLVRERSSLADLCLALASAMGRCDIVSECLKSECADVQWGFREAVRNGQHDVVSLMMSSTFPMLSATVCVDIAVTLGSQRVVRHVLSMLPGGDTRDALQAGLMASVREGRLYCVGLFLRAGAVPGADVLVEAIRAPSVVEDTKARIVDCIIRTGVISLSVLDNVCDAMTHEASAHSHSALGHLSACITSLKRDAKFQLSVAAECMGVCPICTVTTISKSERAFVCQTCRNAVCAECAQPAIAAGGSRCPLCRDAAPLDTNHMAPFMPKTPTSRKRRRSSAAE